MGGADPPGAARRDAGDIPLAKCGAVMSIDGERPGNGKRRTMPRRHYDAYLIRHWHLPSGAERVEIRHIKSGASALVVSLPAALDWIARQEWMTAPAPAPTDTPDLDENGEHG
jgi:hypothetical protein